MSTQNGWRWCHKCQGFFFAGNPSQGVCPAGDSHDASQSGHYAALSGEGILPISEVATSQPSGGLIPAVFSIANPFTGVAVMGEATSKGTGVWGICNDGTGVNGTGTTGVYGSGNANGVIGETKSANDSGVWGKNNGGGTGVFGGSTSGRGVFGNSETWQGVYGHSGTQAGVVGESDQFDGVFGISHDPSKAGVSGHNLNLEYKDNPNGLAGWFGGNVVVTGDIQLINQDCAEDFDISAAEEIEPGTVMVIDQEGSLRPSQQPYDRRVAGVVSGAGDCRPGIILGRQQVQDSKVPVALVGKVYCKVDAACSPVEVGDLLTTSLTPGHAMKADDRDKAFGAVIGKALRRLATGQGLIPILVALQ